MVSREKKGKHRRPEKKMRPKRVLLSTFFCSDDYSLEVTHQRENNVGFRTSLDHRLNGQMRLK